MISLMKWSYVSVRLVMKFVKLVSELDCRIHGVYEIFGVSGLCACECFILLFKVLWAILDPIPEGLGCLAVGLWLLLDQNF